MIVKAVFIDFYGTLVEEDGKIITEIRKEIINNSIQKNIIENNISKYWWEQFTVLCNESCGNKFKTQREIEYISLKRTIEIFESKTDVENMIKKLFYYWENPMIYSDAVYFLENIKVPVIILSNIDNDFILKAVENNKIIVNKIITSEDAGFYKPNDEIFKFALNKCKLEPSEIIHIGDSLSSDVNGANKLGIKTIWLNRNNKINKTENKPDIICNNLKEVLEIIK
jgi:2-haloacid dehalogenase/putative hydrolase of the HAD superfamily